ncbi:MAG: hypothetical protein JSW26_15905 [Desulfobacterales bacterium]|nr:MAG: hypothetical protein JSW26_15905 [Desulfobacterales bacterium]
MRYYYLTDESEKSLAPFFSQRVLSAGLFGVVIVGTFLLVFWPRQPLSDIMVTGKGPTVFFLVFAIALIVNAYINLCCGAGDMIRKGYHMINYPSDQPTYEREIDFYRYGLVEFLLHALVVLLLFLPLLALSAFVSAISLRTFLMAVAILYSASLLCRLFGFTVYLLWGRSSTLGYFTARALMIVFVFITVLFAPAVNPLYLLYLLNQGTSGTGYPFAFYMTVVTLAALVLTWANNALVRRHINRNKAEG